MKKFTINKRKLTYGIIFSLIISLLLCTSVAIAASNDKPQEYPTNHLQNITGQEKAKGFFGSLKSLLFGSDPLIKFSKPFGISIDEATGKIYVADTGNSQIMVFNQEGTLTNNFGEHDLSRPVGIDVSKDKIYVSDSSKGRVYIFNKQGKYIKDFGRYVSEVKRMGRPTGLAIDEKNKRLYVANINDKRDDNKKNDVHNILVYDLEGNFIEVIGKRGTQEGEFNFPINLTVDDEGKLYVVDAINYRIQIFDSQGQFIRMFGQTGITLGDLPRPKGIAVDNQGRIYVADAYLHLIQVFTPQGKPLFFFGKPGQEDGRFVLPADIAIDDEGRIYVVDSGNKRVQVLELRQK